MLYISFWLEGKIGYDTINVISVSGDIYVQTYICGGKMMLKAGIL